MKDENDEFWLYYDIDCKDNGGSEPVWIVSDTGRPSETMVANLDGDGQCLGIASCMSTDQLPPRDTEYQYGCDGEVRNAELSVIAFSDAAVKNGKAVDVDATVDESESDWERWRSGDAGDGDEDEDEEEQQTEEEGDYTDPLTSQYGDTYNDSYGDDDEYGGDDRYGDENHPASASDDNYQDGEGDHSAVLQNDGIAAERSTVPRSHKLVYDTPEMPTSAVNLLLSEPCGRLLLDM
jgi:hypothetical protein